MKNNNDNFNYEILRNLFSIVIALSIYYIYIKMSKRINDDFSVNSFQSKQKKKKATHLTFKFHFATHQKSF